MVFLTVCGVVFGDLLSILKFLFNSVCFPIKCGKAIAPFGNFFVIFGLGWASHEKILSRIGLKDELIGSSISKLGDFANVLSICVTVLKWSSRKFSRVGVSTWVTTDSLKLVFEVVVILELGVLVVVKLTVALLPLLSMLIGLGGSELNETSWCTVPAVSVMESVTDSEAESGSEPKWSNSLSLGTGGAEGGAQVFYVLCNIYKEII